MGNELYFIPIIEQALGDREPRPALRLAFGKIKRLGAHEPYRSGFGNFQQFMEEVRSCRNLARTDHARALIVELATAGSGFSAEQRRAALAFVERNPEWKSEYEQLLGRFGARSSHERSPVIQVYCDGKEVGEMTFDEPGTSRSLGDIVPGAYLLKLATGLALWEGQLSGRDLLLLEALGPENLKLAAETEPVRRRSTGEIMLLGGEVILRVFAGIECGDMEVEWVE